MVGPHQKGFNDEVETHLVFKIFIDCVEESKLCAPHIPGMIIPLGLHEHLFVSTV